MTTNSNIGATIQGTNNSFAPGGLGLDNPGAQTCTNCRKSVVPQPVNGIRVAFEVGDPNNGKSVAGYNCPSCGHSFTMVKSTGRAGGPAPVGNTNQNSAADF